MFQITSSTGAHYVSNVLCRRCTPGEVFGIWTRAFSASSCPTCFRRWAAKVLRSGHADCTGRQCLRPGGLRGPLLQVAQCQALKRFAKEGPEQQAHSCTVKLLGYWPCPRLCLRFDPWRGGSILIKRCNPVITCISDVMQEITDGAVRYARSELGHFHIVICVQFERQ